VIRRMVHGDGASGLPILVEDSGFRTARREIQKHAGFKRLNLIAAFFESLQQFGFGGCLRGQQPEICWNSFRRLKAAGLNQQQQDEKQSNF